MVVNLSAICNYPELLIALKSMDISVPARTNGRKTHHAESWTICRMLSTLGDCGHLDYPLSLKHRDRPDFLLQSGAVEIGIEATEAVSEQYAAYSALAEREFPEALREPAHFKLGAPKRTLKEMREILRRGKLTAEPWAGDQPEKEWATYMANVV